MRPPTTPKRERLIRIGEVVRRLTRGVPGHLDLEDPLPRGRGPADAAADARRLPALRRGRRRAAGDDPAPPARRVPAAARDPRRARRSGRGRAEATAAGRHGRAGRGDRPRRALPPLGRRAGARQGARGLRPPRALRDRRGEALPGDATPTSRASARSSSGSGSRRATSARSGRRPTARSALLEQVVAPALRARNAERRAAGAARPPVARRARTGARGAALLARPPRGGGVSAIDLRTRIREVQDFPTPGVGFKDITPLLADRDALRQAIGDLADWVRGKEPDLVLGAEARGFILGAAIAAEAGCGFVPARRPGKLPPETVERDLRARVRPELARAPSGPDPRGLAGRDPRRRARDGGDRGRDPRPRRAARRRGDRRLLHHRAHRSSPAASGSRGSTSTP